MKYDALNWESLDFIKAHFYRRLATPLNKTIEILERVENAGDKTLAVRRLGKTRQTVEALLNAVNAWATLITYKANGPLDAYQLHEFTREDLPGWFYSYLGRETNLRVEFEQTLNIHPETFIEGTVLLFNIANAVSNVYTVQISDAVEQKGVFMRVIFANRDDEAPFGSLTEIIETFDYEILGERDMAVQLAVARDMMLLNNARFSLQNNKKTGQQAFSAFFRAYDPNASDDDALEDGASEPSAPIELFSYRSDDVEPHISGDSDPDAPGEAESEAAAARETVPDTRPLSISREMVERIEERLKAIQIMDEDAIPLVGPGQSSDQDSVDRKNGKRDDDTDVRTPFGW